LKALFKAYHRRASNYKFIKGLVHNLHKTGRQTLVQWYDFIQTILKSEENGGMRNIDIHNSPSEWYDITGKYLSAILPVILFVLWGHIAQVKAIPHFNMADKCYFHDINTLKRAFCEFQYCGSLEKCGRIFAEQKHSSWPQFVRYQSEGLPSVKFSAW